MLKRVAFPLLPHLSVGENIALPGWVAGQGRAELGSRARDLLGRVGLADRQADPVANLSGGEMQRVAICRALLRSPGLVLADEPTGNLDEATAASVMDLMLELVSEAGAGLLMVTHSAALAGRMSRRLHLRAGQVA